jgi:hypothetical protein
MQGSRRTRSFAKSRAYLRGSHFYKTEAGVVRGSGIQHRAKTVGSNVSSHLLKALGGFASRGSPFDSAFAQINRIRSASL